MRTVSLAVLLTALELFASLSTINAATIPEGQQAIRQQQRNLERIPLLTPQPLTATSPTSIPAKSPRSWTGRLKERVLHRLLGKNRHESHTRHIIDEKHKKHLGMTSSLLSQYAGDILLRFNLTSDAEGKAMVEASRVLFLDIWSATRDHVDIRVAEDVLPSVLGLLPHSMQHSHMRLLHDLGRAVLETYLGAPKPFSNTDYDVEDSSGPLRLENLFFHDYQPISVILPWMEFLEKLFPEHVQIVTIGKSYEGKDIKGLRVGNSLSTRRDGERKKAVVVTGAAHAREWISVSTVCFLAYNFITAHTREKDTTALVNQFDWIFIPTLNIDGYQYTWETDRLWRKNRQPTTLSFCKGIDLDRSYSFQWDASEYPSNPCSDNYPGEHPFEAVESKAFAEWVANATTNDYLDFVGFVDFHSYSQQILYPYSYSCKITPPDLENLEELAIGLAKAIRMRSTEHYEVASACDGSGPFTQSETGGGGSALDYMYNHHVPYAYQIKLRDTGNYGFLLPRENIIPTGEEALGALKYFGEFLMGINAKTRKDGVTSEDESIREQIELRRR